MNAALSFDPDDRAQEIQDEAITGLIESWNEDGTLYELLTALFESEAEVLVALRKASEDSRSAPSYQFGQFQQHVRAFVKNIEGRIDAAETKDAADAADMRDHYRQTAREDRA